MLPASLMQRKESVAWPGASMDPEQQVEFVYNVTQVVVGRVDTVEGRVDLHDEIFKEMSKWATDYFGFGKNPFLQNERGDA